MPLNASSGVVAWACLVLLAHLPPPAPTQLPAQLPAGPAIPAIPLCFRPGGICSPSVFTGLAEG